MRLGAVVAAMVIVSATLGCGSPNVGGGASITTPHRHVEFEPLTCTAGWPEGFYGVDLVDGDGTRLRFVQLPNGNTTAHLFPAFDRRIVSFEGCFDLHLSDWMFRHHGPHGRGEHRVIGGDVWMYCDVDGYTLKGKMRFTCS